MSYAGNILRGDAFEFDRELAKVGKPLDRTEWEHVAANGQRLLQHLDE